MVIYSKLNRTCSTVSSRNLETWNFQLCSVCEGTTRREHKKSSKTNCKGEIHGVVWREGRLGGNDLEEEVDG